MLVLKNICLFVAGKLLLNDANLNITPGARIGVVGRNGSGKSHLMELLAGNVGTDAGERELADGATVLLIKQQLPDGDESPLEFVRNNDPDIQEAEAALTTATGEKLAESSSRLTELDEERYEKLAPTVLMGLGLTEKELTQPMRHLSGGMRMRINLAMALIRTPDVLLLDEPTNHLDLESSQWLISYLKNYPSRCAVVIVSHDLTMLKQVTNSTVHLRSGVLTEFSGDYQAYRERLDAKEHNDIQKNADLEKEIDRHEKIYYRFRSLPAKRAAQAVAQHDKANKKREQLIEIIKEEPIIPLSFGEPADLRDPIIDLNGVAIGYHGKTILNDVNLSVQYGTKIGLLGRNGEGKSTLIRLLVDKLSPQHGVQFKSPGLKVGYFSQDEAEELTSDSTVCEEFVAKTGIKKEADIRSMLANFGFSYDKIGTKIADLSGGEKSRLQFCLICSRSPNLIILDEPTNHFDVETREELAKAIKNFKGSVILVSHDADLHKETMDKFWLAKDGMVKAYGRGIEHYQRQLQQEIDKNLLDHSAASEKAKKTPAREKSNAAPSAPVKKGNKVIEKREKNLNPNSFYAETSRSNSSKGDGLK